MKITELQIKKRVSELNLGPLKATPVGLYMKRTSKGYEVAVQYRVNGHVEGGIYDASASEAWAYITGFAAAYKYIAKDKG
jgi:hypothetical protein